MRKLWVMVALLMGCGDEVVQEKCVQMGTSDIIAQSLLLSLDDYGAGVNCDGDRAEAGSIPLSTRRFVAGSAIKLDLPPGPHTLVLWAFADTDGTQLLGSACAQKTFVAGSQICLDLTVNPAPDGGEPPDLAGLPPPPDLANVPCDVTCGGVCCRNLNGSCNADCTLACAPLYADCNGDPSDGCELPTNVTASCSACGVSCDTTTTVGGTCNVQGSACTYSSCANGRSDCDKTTPNANGCECEGSACCGTGCQNKHSDGYGEHFFDCVALGTHNQAQAEAAGVAWDPAGTFPSGKDPLHYTDTKGDVYAVCRNSTARGSCVCFIYDVQNGNTYMPYLGTSYASKFAGSCLLGISGMVGQYPPWN
jgi:hypothetical protein